MKARHFCDFNNSLQLLNKWFCLLYLGENVQLSYSLTWHFPGVRLLSDKSFDNLESGMVFGSDIDTTCKHLA